MADYRKHTMRADDTTGYQRFDDANDDAEEDQYEHLIGPEPYVPPIAEDPELPATYAADVAAIGTDAIRDTGFPPMKRTHLINPGFADYTYGVNHFNFNEGGVNRDLRVPHPHWDRFNYDTNAHLRAFFDDTVVTPHPDVIFPRLLGPYDGFNHRMSTAEMNITHNHFHFDGFRPIVPDIGYAAGVIAMWLKRHLDLAHPELFRPQYKALVSLHCVFIKHYDRGETEYRRFIFDSMCEDDNGHRINSQTAERLFKMCYNTTIKLAYEKLDMRNCQNIPDVDSRFEFYAISTVAITAFQYEPLR